MIDIRNMYSDNQLYNRFAKSKTQKPKPMKKLILVLLMLPIMALAQKDKEYRIFETANLTPKSGEVEQLEAGIKAHNKKYHAEGDFAARVYWIANGRYTGNYHWSMGSLPWSAMDNTTWDESEHASDWNKNVQAHITPWSGDQSYWKFNAELSQFPKDFTLKNLHATYFDVKRGEWENAMTLIKKVVDVYRAKLPDTTFGIYTNELPSTKNGRDIVMISFFDKAAWMGEDHSIKSKYEEVHGAGSFADFIKDWIAVTNGSESELWIFRPDLSGKSGQVKASPQK